MLVRMASTSVNFDYDDLLALCPQQADAEVRLARKKADKDWKGNTDEHCDVSLVDVVHGLLRPVYIARAFARRAH